MVEALESRQLFAVSTVSIGPIAVANRGATLEGGGIVQVGPGGGCIDFTLGGVAGAKQTLITVAVERHWGGHEID